MTLTFDDRGHGACGWSSSSIRIPSLKFVGLAIRKIGARCVSALIGLVTLTFDRLTLKPVCESHLRWGTFLPNFGTLDLWVLELYMRRTDRRTDGQKQRLLPLPYGGGGIIKQGHRLATPRLVFTSYHILAARIQTVACSVDVTWRCWWCHRALWRRVLTDAGLVSDMDERDESWPCRAAQRSADESTMTPRDQQAKLLTQKINSVKLERSRMLASLSQHGTWL